MSAQNDLMPAFPVQDTSKWQAHGLTMRDYFAAKAMHAAMRMDMAHSPAGMLQLAETAYLQADAMLKAREVAS